MSVAIRQQRFPLGIAAVTRHPISHDLVLSAAGGLSVVPFTLRGAGLGPSTPGTRLDAGFHVATELRFFVHDLRPAPFIDVHADYFPRSYTVEVDPLGTIGRTGHLWIGASLGVSLDSHR